MNTKRTVYQFVESKGVTDVFVISGGYNINIIDAFYEQKIKLWFFHNQQSLVFAAEGYYRMSGKPPICLVTAGPGMMNTINGIYGCWTDSIPLFIISGNCPRNQINHINITNCRQLGEQDSDVVNIVKPIVKYSKLVTNGVKLWRYLSQAWNEMLFDRPGPVLVDIPLDIQCQEWTPNDGWVDIITALNASKNPIIVIGNGVRLGDSVELLDTFVKRHGIPVVTGCNSGADCIDNTYQYYAGRIGIMGQPTSNQLVNESDLILVLGSRLNFKMTGYAYDEFAKDAKKIIVDIDENEINKHSFDVVGVVSDVWQVLTYLNESHNISMTISEWQNHVKEVRRKQVYCYPKHLQTKGYLSYYYFVSKLPQYLDSRPIVLANGTANVTTFQMYKLNRGQRMFSNIGSASMGWGLPAAIGTAISTGQQVVCIEGDGSIMMNLQQLQTLRSYNLPVKLFLINNNGYTSIKISQTSFCGSRLYGSTPETGITFPKFQELSKSFDIPYFSIKNNEEVDDMMTKIMKHKGLCLIELFVNPEEKHEPKVMSQGIDENGKIIPGKLTNMFIG